VHYIDLVGWASSVVLLATIGRQVYTQWKTRVTEGVSKWLFIGQVTASTGYTIYSILLHNWVFMTSNIALLGTALLGEALFLKNRRRRPAQQADATTL
jgi:MtN3 and saliva related transmembrane protein